MGKQLSANSKDKRDPGRKDIAMQATVTGFKFIRPDYKQIFFRCENGKSYKTHADMKCGNAQKWFNLDKGDVIYNFVIMPGPRNVINADSLFTLVPSGSSTKPNQSVLKFFTPSQQPKKEDWVAPPKEFHDLIKKLGGKN